MRYSVYIISKSRPKCITARALDKMGVDYKIVVEPCDKDEYAALWGEEKLYVCLLYTSDAADE